MKSLLVAFADAITTVLAIQARKTALVGAALAGTRGPDDKSEALQNLELLFSD